MSRGRIELIFLDNYRGAFDTRTKKRLPNLYPNKFIDVKVKARAYENGFTYMRSHDLAQKTRGMGKFISVHQYKQLRNQFPNDR